MTERYEIRETKEYSFEVYDHLDRGKKIATFLYFTDAARFCGTPHADRPSASRPLLSQTEKTGGSQA